MQPLKKLSMIASFKGGRARLVCRADHKVIYDQTIKRESARGLQKILTTLTCAVEMINDKTVGPTLSQIGPVIQSALGTDVAEDLQRAVFDKELAPTVKPKPHRGSA